MLRKDPARNALVVGPRAALGCHQFTVENVNWVSGQSPESGRALQVKIRYKATAVPCRISETEGGELTVTLDEPALGVTPGQGAVFFDGPVCLGGGLIAMALDGEAESMPTAVFAGGTQET